jgi:hypothetical protein
MKNKGVIKKTLRGVYFVEIPQNFLRITKLQEGDEIEFIPGSAVSIKKDDLIIRKIP